MPTQCSCDLFGYEVVEGRQVVAAFDGGDNSSDAGGLLLGATDRAIGLVGRFAACFADGRAQAQVEHPIEAMVAQRVFGIALGYEDLVDHDQLRHDPVLATLAGKLTARRKDCAPLAGKSTLNRLEHAPSEPSRYHKIGHDGAAIERLFVDLFLEAYTTLPKEIILDLDATDDPLHGHQEGRFFHGYYDCYCYLPLANGVARFPVMPNLAGQVASYSAVQLRAFRDGARTNPLMKDAVRHLSDADIEALAAYYAPKEPMQGDADPELAARGKPLYEGEGLANPSHVCAACHGPNGEGNAAAAFPALRGQHAEYTVIALRAYGTGERPDPTGIMAEIAKSLSEDQMLARAAYAENLSEEASGAGGNRAATSP